MKSTSIFLFLLAIIKVAFHLYFYGQLEFHRDELLYFSLGQHPAFGYASIPPLTGWIALAMQSIFGFSLWSAKIFPAILSGFFLLLCAKMTKELGGQSFAQILVGIAILSMPFAIRVFHLFQPVCIDLFLWTLLFYYVLKFLKTEKDQYLLILGGIVGIAMLNKYLVALLVISLLLSFLFSGRLDIFKNKFLYYGLGIALVIFLPNLIWQMANGLPVINHMSELNETQLVNINRLNILLDLLIMPFWATPIIFIGFVFLSQEKRYRPLIFAIIFVILILLILRGKAYYAMGIYPILLGAGAIFIEQKVQHRFFLWSIPFLIFGLSLLILPFGIPIYETEKLVQYFQTLEKDYGIILGRQFEDGSIHSLPQDYADQIGWTELTRIVNKAYLQVPEKSKCIIYGENYGQAGAISIIGKQFNLPEAISFSDNFRYWAPKHFDPEIQYFIYINDELGEDVAALFSIIQNIGQVENIHSRSYGTTVYLCSKPKRSFNEFWSEVLQHVNQN